MWLFISVFVNLWNSGSNLANQAFDEAKDKAIEALLNVINRAIPVLDNIVPTVDIDFFESISALLPVSDIDVSNAGSTALADRINAETRARRQAQQDAEAQRDAAVPPSTPVGSGGGSVVDPQQSATRYLQFSSPPFIKADDIEKDIKFYRGTHIALTLFISGISMTIEVLTLGQVDKIVEGLMVIYNLTTVPLIYDQSLAIEQEAKLMRPYRYLTEAKYKSQIPPMSDLITMSVREQLGDTPEETLTNFIRMMEYQGFDEFWSRAYWESHWILPNTSELFEMFGRGIISPEELRFQLVVNDIKPEWIDRIMELSLRLPSRTEARMINRTRRMTQVQIDQIIKAERIHPDYQDDFAYFINNQEIDTINLRIIREQISLYEKGFITEPEIRELIKYSILSPDEQDKTIELSGLAMQNDIAVRDLQTWKLWARKQLKANPDARIEIQNELSKFIKDKFIVDSHVDQEMARQGLDFDLQEVE